MFFFRRIKGEYASLKICTFMNDFLVCYWLRCLSRSNQEASRLPTRWRWMNWVPIKCIAMLVMSRAVNHSTASSWVVRIANRTIHSSTLALLSWHLWSSMSSLWVLDLFPHHTLTDFIQCRWGRSPCSRNNTMGHWPEAPEVQGAPGAPQRQMQPLQGLIIFVSRST
jgi:hypothetical protein